MSDGLERRFQQYTRMKIENKAPEMEFDKGGLYMFNGKEQEAPHNLKENSAPYKLVVFWESTCSHCLELLPQLKNNYVELQKAGVEVFGINMDENKEEMRKVSEAYPWGNYCDGKGLLGEIAQKYYVSATPSMYLIDSSGSLALRPVKIEEIMRFLQERSKL
jgi:thiol-disulfide isomerase/thioredoxin